MYSPARLLEDSEPCRKKHSQSRGRRRNCDGKGAQGAGSQWNQERTHSYQGTFLSMLSINLLSFYLLVNKSESSIHIQLCLCQLKKLNWKECVLYSKFTSISPLIKLHTL